ncbi:HAD hydrolase family protein [Thiotrichales bacterium 19S11-10]|nr:HAD hydrolase family protein [Thiotrichales bacterium 19S11-10]MCF6807944.1 HAD hydrolase family protein [Thiotrichales bacterium 19S9-11]MCF6811959.1 HAD hydrolase family protein [Thiotrichales bacterium 19S9-12]
MPDNKILNKLKSIQLIIYDVDGIMTNGNIILENQPNGELKCFNVKDGLGMKLLSQIGIKQVILTGKQSDIVKKRFSSLNADAIFQGKSNKLNMLDIISLQFNIQPEAMLMIGDDLPDLAVMKRCHVSVATRDAHPWVLENVDYITKHNGGTGAVRELCDLILTAHGLKQEILNSYIEHGEAKLNVLQ